MTNIDINPIKKIISDNNSISDTIYQIKSYLGKNNTNISDNFYLICSLLRLGGYSQGQIILNITL